MPRAVASSFCTLLVISALAVFLPAIASAQVSFTGYNYYGPDNEQTFSVVSGDFDNDGILDLVSIDDGNISFYKGLGGGLFADAVNQSMFLLNGALAADFNGDGKLDLIALGGSFSGNTITVLLGNGDGTFTTGQSITVNGSPEYLSLADFNGDHLPDIAVTSCPYPAPCSTQVFLDQGGATFNQSANLSYGGGPMVAGDFNADGHQDLAIAVAGLVMYMGNGDGTFQAPVVASQANAGALAIGDFYNDRIQSLAFLTSGSTSGTYVATARYTNGTIEVSTPQLASAAGVFSSIAGGDLNGDFLDDIVLVGGKSVYPHTTVPYSGYMLGKGDGTFHAAEKAPVYLGIETTPFIRDLNLDSRHDVGIAWGVSGDEEGGVFVLLDNNAIRNCNPPAANVLGVNICAPQSGQTIGQTFTFKGAGNAFNGIAKRMELWIDGEKIGQNLEDQLNVTATLSPGSHTASFVVVDSFDNYTAKSVTFTTN
jgi:hypothetical protein